MKLLAVVCYFFFVSNIGLVFVGRRRDLAVEKLTLGFLIGSVLIGLYFFAVAELNFINVWTTSALVLLGLICTLAQYRTWLSACRSGIQFLRENLIKNDKFSMWFFVLIALLIIWILILAYSPPRAADAMRYHLAELKDILIHHGLYFRPYLNYNFPLFFSFLFFPIFMFIGGVGIKLAICLYFLLSLNVLVHIAKGLRFKRTRLLILFLFLIPIAYHEAHSALNDWPLIFYVLLGLLFLLKSSENKNYAYAAFAALGFAAGIKYQAVIFVPWFVCIAWCQLTTMNSFKRFKLIIKVLIVCALVPCVFYIRNFINLLNPVWPLAIKGFPYKDLYLHQVALGFNHTVTGKHSIGAIFESIKAIVYFPLIPAAIWVLAIPGLFWGKKTPLKLSLGFVLFFILFWIMQPVIHPRSGIYILPVTVLLIVNFYDYLVERGTPFLLLCYRLILTVTFMGFIGIAVYYSGFYLRYTATGDLKAYHRYTWFYNDYDWINHNTPKEAKILVVVSAGQTYYLDRDYLRADPALSGLIDWDNMANVKDFLNKLHELKINYVFYEKTDWSPNPGGTQLMKVMRELGQSSCAKTIYSNTERLYGSRMQKQYSITKVELIKIKSSSACQ